MLFLAPIFLFVTIIMGLNNFSDTYQIIEKSFGNQIEAISLVAASFLDGDEIADDSMREYQPQGMVYVPARMRLLAVDAQTGWLLEIDPVHGGAIVLNKNLRAKLVGLAFDESQQMYYGVDADGNVYSSSEYTLPNLQDFISLNHSANGLAFNGSNQQLYVSGDGFYQIDLVSKSISSINQNDYADYIGLTYNAGNNTLYTMRRDPVALCRINIGNGEVVNQPPLQFEDESAAEEQPDGLPGELPADVVWNALQYDRVMQSNDDNAIQEAKTNIVKLLAQTDRQVNQAGDEAGQEEGAGSQGVDGPFPPGAPVYGLAWKPQIDNVYISSGALLEVDPNLGAVVQNAIWPGYRNEMSEAFLANVSPMRRIKEKLNVTYLYTFTRSSETDLSAITYNIDSNFDDDHTWIGTEDSLPAESIFDLYGRILLGQIYQSEIVEWDEWGLMKTGYAPIFGRDGSVRAVVGTDVNVSVIGAKTRAHLLETIALGLLAFLLALLVMYAVTTAMTKPILLLNETALLVAAGEYGKKTPELGAKEFHGLSHAFNQLSHDMKEAQEKREFDNRILHYQTTRAELVRKLVKVRDMLVPSQIEGWRAHHWNLGANEVALSAMLKDVSGAMAWAGAQQANSLLVLKTQIDVASISRKLLRSLKGDWTQISSALTHYYTESIQGFFFIHRKDQRFYSLCRAPFVCFHINQASLQRIGLSGTGSFPVESGDAFVIVSAAVADAVQAALERQPVNPGADRVHSLSERVQTEIANSATPIEERCIMLVMEWA